MDPYVELGLTRGASNDEIKQAYRKLVLQFHPDRHASSSKAEQEAAAARFKVVTEAYDILSDDRARAHYHTSTSSRGASSAYRHPGVNTDWSHSQYTGGSSYTSTLSRWEWYKRLARHGMRGFGQTLHLGLAVLLVGGGLLFEYSHAAIWQVRNKGKSFEEMQAAIQAEKQRKASSSSTESIIASSSSSSSSRGTSETPEGSSSSSSRVWHLHSAWADNMRGRFVSSSEDIPPQTASSSSSS